MKKKVKLLGDVMTKRIVTIPAMLSILKALLKRPQMPAGIVSASDIVREIGKSNL